MYSFSHRGSNRLFPLKDLHQKTHKPHWEVTWLKWRLFIYIYSLQLVSCLSPIREYVVNLLPSGFHYVRYLLVLSRIRQKCSLQTTIILTPLLSISVSRKFKKKSRYWIWKGKKKTQKLAFCLIHFVADHFSPLRTAHPPWRLFGSVSPSSPWKDDNQDLNKIMV